VQAKWTYRSVSWVKDEVAIGPTIPAQGAGIPGQAVFFGDAKFPLCMVDPNRETADPAAWCTDIGGFVNTSSPTIGNPVGGVQTIYIGDRNNVFWAIDSKTHQPLWHWKIPLDGDVHGSPIIHPLNGTVYVSCGCTTVGVLYAWEKSPIVDADGVAIPKWQVYIRPGIRYSQLAGFVPTPGAAFRMYIGTANGGLAAIDDNGATGGVPGERGQPNQPNWSLKLKLGKVRATKNYHSSPSIGPDGTIYVGTDKGIFAVKDNGNSGEVRSLFADNVTGEWDTAFSIDNVRGSGRPRTLLYASVHYANVRTFYAIDITDPDHPQKLFKYGPFRGTSSTSHTVTPAPVVDANSIVYAAIGPTVFAFDPRHITAANPQPAWTFELTNRGDAISLAVGESVLYVAAKDFTLYALEAKPKSKPR
jgi:outer membrane protein assembly factor BamB